MPTIGVSTTATTVSSVTIPGPVGQIVVTQISGTGASGTTTGITVDGTVPVTMPSGNAHTPIMNATQKWLPGTPGASIVFAPQFVGGQPVAQVTVTIKTGASTPDLEIAW